MLADLHLHTYYSDSTRSPEEVVLSAKSAGIGLISVCDHNTDKAYPELVLACEKHAIKLINGIEVDCMYNGYWLHLLAYGSNFQDTGLKTVLSSNWNGMENVSIELIEKMSQDYEVLSIKEYEKFERNKSNGGWKGLDYLSSKRLASDYIDCLRLFSKYDAAPPKCFPDVRELCDIIHNAGGYAVLAHPYNYFPNDYIKLRAEFKSLIALGVDGVECYYPSHDEEMTKVCVDFCQENNLIITAGSDDHGNFLDCIEDVTYKIGVIKIDIKNLNLKGLI